MDKFQHNSPYQFLGIHGQPQVSKEFSIIRSHVLGPINNPFPAFSISIYTLMHNFNTRSPLIFLGSHGGEKNHQEFLTIRSHVLGPIKRPLTASNQPKHRKTLKMGIKTQVGRKSYLLELSKTRKPGVHA